MCVCARTQIYKHTYGSASYFETNLFQEAARTLNCSKSKLIFSNRNNAKYINPFQDPTFITTL